MLIAKRFDLVPARLGQETNDARKVDTTKTDTLGDHLGRPAVLIKRESFSLFRSGEGLGYFECPPPPPSPPSPR